MILDWVAIHLQTWAMGLAKILRDLCSLVITERSMNRDPSQELDKEEKLER